ncbi:MAG: hypothetical protein H0Z34_09400 [Brevibacillus sp.]|nr:hypothetical protein [Brevibacillus sp.]
MNGSGNAFSRVAKTCMCSERREKAAYHPWVAPVRHCDDPVDYVQADYLMNQPASDRDSNS